MKKIYGILLAVAVLFLVGCEKKLTCTSANNEYSSSFFVEYEGKSIEDITWRTKYATDDMYEYMCSFMKNKYNDDVICDNQIVTVTDYEELLEEKELNIDTFKKNLENDKYTCK